MNHSRHFVIPRSTATRNLTNAALNREILPERKKEMLEKILALRADRIGDKDSVAILRELRGYKE
jgi:hypothetical protein